MARASRVGAPSGGVGSKRKQRVVSWLVGTLLHYDGDRWNGMSMSPQYDFQDLAGASTNEVYLRGIRNEGSIGDRVVFRFDGNVWQPSIQWRFIRSSYHIGMVGNTLYSLAMGWALRGGAWQQELAITDAPLQGIYGVNASNIFVVGSNLSFINTTVTHGSA